MINSPLPNKPYNMSLANAKLGLVKQYKLFGKSAELSKSQQLASFVLCISNLWAWCFPWQLPYGQSNTWKVQDRVRLKEWASSTRAQLPKSKDKVPRGREGGNAFLQLRNSSRWNVGMVSPKDSSTLASKRATGINRDKTHDVLNYELSHPQPYLILVMGATAMDTLERSTPYAHFMPMMVSDWDFKWIGIWFCFEAAERIWERKGQG